MLGILSCGGYDPDSTGGTGNIAFKIDWQDASTTSKVSLRGEGEAISKNSTDLGFSPAYAPLDCTASGVSKVSATVYDSSNNSIATGEWNCSAHSGNIEKVPAGSNRRLVVLGKDTSGNILYSGEQTGITVEDGKTSPTVTITVIPTVSGTTVTDIDGNVYNTVTIGTQVWMKENLKVTKYRNGTAIGTTTGDISGETSPKYQWAYDGNESNVSTYGRLYTWYAATDSRGLCPTGWHVPTDSEWTTLTDYLGGGSVAGGKMKEAGTTHWSSPNTSADNSSGFTALPGGSRNYGGTFYSIGFGGSWWSATEYDTANAWDRFLYYYGSYANRNYFGKNYGFSVRCVRD